MSLFRRKIQTDAEFVETIRRRLPKERRDLYWLLVGFVFFATMLGIILWQYLQIKESTLLSDVTIPRLAILLGLAIGFILGLFMECATSSLFALLRWRSSKRKDRLLVGFYDELGDLRARAAAAQMQLFGSAADRLARELKSADLDAMTPLAALDLLRKLKAEL